jgi:sugar lactone lactonase YvrE
MNAINEVLRVAAPAPRPQAIAFDGTLLWVGSIERDRLYALDPHHWTVREEIAVPGKPYGMTVLGDELRVILSQGDEDHRTIYRVTPGRGWHQSGAIPCPDDTGSHLSYDGDRLYVSQWYDKKIVAVDGAGRAGTTVVLPHEICGHTIVGGKFYCLTTDDETSGRYYLTRVDARGAAPQIDDIATLAFDARGLAYDGERFWTNHREAHQTVAFTAPL